MDKYRKQDMFSDEEINLFSQNEKEKILTRIEHKEATPKEAPNWLLRATSLIIAIIVIAIFAVLVPNWFDNGSLVTTTTEANGNDTSTSTQNNGNYLDVIQLNATTFMVTSSSPSYDLNFYFDFKVVYEAEKTSLNTDFDYSMSYVPVPGDVVDSIDLQLDVFRVGDYRYYAQYSYDGQTFYTEAILFPYEGFTYTKVSQLNSMDFVDFQADIQDVFNLIEDYPPTLITLSEHGYQRFEPNPNIDEIGDQRRIDNYNTYVSNIYMDDSYCVEGEEKTEQTELVNQLIVLDSENTVMRSSFSSMGYDRLVDYEEIENNIENYFNFYAKDSMIALRNSTFELNQLDGDISGQRVVFKYDDNIYVYFRFDLEATVPDLSTTTTVKYTYRLSGIYDSESLVQEPVIQAFAFEGNLILEPLLVVEPDPYPNGLSNLFREMQIDFYDSEDNLIYTMNFGSL